MVLNKEIFTSIKHKSESVTPTRTVTTIEQALTDKIRSITASRQRSNIEKAYTDKIRSITASRQRSNIEKALTDKIRSVTASRQRPSCQLTAHSTFNDDKKLSLSTQRVEPKFEDSNGQVKFSFLKEQKQPPLEGPEIKGRDVFKPTTYTDAICYKCDITKAQPINTKALLDYSKQTIKKKYETTVIDTFEDRPVLSKIAIKTKIDFDLKTGREDDLLYKQSELHRNIRLENIKACGSRAATCKRKYSFMNDTA